MRWSDGGAGGEHYRGEENYDEADHVEVFIKGTLAIWNWRSLSCSIDDEDDRR